MLITTDDISSIDYKRQLAKRFDRAALSYDSYADFQKTVLDRLSAMLPTDTADYVMDLGSGTGQALPTLCDQIKPDSCVALDLSHQMLSVARDRFSHLQCVEYVCSDADALPFRDKTFNLVFSNLVIQWCLSPTDLLKELYRVIQPDGYVVFSTLLKGSMPEITKAWTCLDNKEHVHQYMTMDVLLACLKSSGFAVLSSESSTVSMWFDSPEESIYSLKKVGASLIQTHGAGNISPTKWKAFLNEYEAQREIPGIPLSYQVAFVVAQKPFSAL